MNDENWCPIPHSLDGITQKIYEVLHVNYRYDVCSGMGSAIKASESGRIVLPNHLIEWGSEGLRISSYARTEDF